MKEFGKKRSWCNGSIVSALVVGAKEIHENLSEDSRCPDRDSNRTLPEYEARMLQLS
jgi:hypothetical protein